ncbi:hypothetical protein C7M84_007549 [Penaeus vannamei]|uniref:Uncharacterized protein n=1 Tax=Penaeus vannamei TaxID=6689 RepID=A0A3R7ST74_PENVA|nr:hypothetical protein C7M84_007549 [Penaeus vannamei]
MPTPSPLSTNRIQRPRTGRALVVNTYAVPLLAILSDTRQHTSLVHALLLTTLLSRLYTLSLSLLHTVSSLPSPPPSLPPVRSCSSLSRLSLLSQSQGVAFVLSRRKGRSSLSLSGSLISSDMPAPSLGSATLAPALCSSRSLTYYSVSHHSLHSLLPRLSVSPSLLGLSSLTCHIQGSSTPNSHRLASNRAPVYPPSSRFAAHFSLTLLTPPPPLSSAILLASCLSLLLCSSSLRSLSSLASPSNRYLSPPSALPFPRPPNPLPSLSTLTFSLPLPLSSSLPSLSPLSSLPALLPLPSSSLPLLARSPLSPLSLSLPLLLFPPSSRLLLSPSPLPPLPLSLSFPLSSHQQQPREEASAAGPGERAEYMRLNVVLMSPGSAPKTNIPAKHAARTRNDTATQPAAGGRDAARARNDRFKPKRLLGGGFQPTHGPLAPVPAQLVPEGGAAGNGAAQDNLALRAKI